MFRRRQRSFSDGDIDGDYKYLLDEQVVMAMSLCAPVSFHHEKEKEEKEPASTTVLPKDLESKVIAISADAPIAEDDTPSTIANSSSSAAADNRKDILVEPVSPITPTQPPSLTHEEECIAIREKEKEKEIASARRIRSLSDMSISERAVGRDLHLRERESSQNSKNNSKSSSPVQSKSKMAPLPFSVNFNINDPVTETESVGMTTNAARTIAKVIIAPAPASVTPRDITSTAVSTVAAMDTPRNTSLEAISPPSWSWTWGALPVKSKISTADLTQLAPPDSKAASGGSQGASYKHDLDVGDGYSMLIGLDEQQETVASTSQVMMGTGEVLSSSG